MYFNYRELNSDQKYLMEIQTAKQPFGHAVSLRIKSTDNNNPDLSVGATIILRDKKYTTSMAFPDTVESLEDSEMVTSLSQPLIEKSREIQDTLNDFHNDPRAYVQKIDEVSRKNKDKEALEFYLPLAPFNLSQEHAKKALLSIEASGLVGNVSRDRKVNSDSRELLKGLEALCETIPNTYVAEEAPLSSMADIILEIKNEKNNNLSFGS